MTIELLSLKKNDGITLKKFVMKVAIPSGIKTSSADLCLIPKKIAEIGRNIIKNLIKK